MGVDRVNRPEIIDVSKGVSIIAIYLCHIVQVFEVPSVVSCIPDNYLTS